MKMKLFLYFMILAVHGSNTCFKRYCSCSRKRLRTSCFSLHFVPSIPDYSGTLQLMNNHFNEINRSLFRNVSSSERLKILIIQNNSLNYIAPDAFKDLKHIKTLEVSYENGLNKSYLKNSLQSLNSSSIEKIRFENNEWNDLPEDMFRHLANASLYSISLNSNKFRNLNTSAFIPLRRMKKLYCRKNQIVSIDAIGLQTVEHLDLTSNHLFEIPNFCNGQKSLAPRLRVLTLNDNALRFISSEQLKCLPNIQELLLDLNRFTSIQDDAFAGILKLKRLSIGRVTQLRKLSPRAFNSSSIQTLQFKQNGFRFDNRETFDKDTVFKYLPKLTYLDLARNYLPGDALVLLKMFSSLRKLKKLNLQAASLNIIPDGFLQQMPSLEILLLQGNTITKWRRRAFQNMSSLKILNLSGNSIHLINQTSFPMDLIDNLYTLDLSYNPFWCVCEQLWFLGLLRKSEFTSKLINWPGRYECSYPDKLKNRNIKNYKPSADECDPQNPLIVMAILVSVVGCLIILLFIFLLKCQTNLRNLSYLIRLNRRLKHDWQSSSTEVQFYYDAFVVYCDTDRQWVHTVLLKRLEDSGLRLCIHHRDFIIGVPIADNIENCMNKSGKLIVVMSNTFARSEWCQWELCLVQERRRRLGKDSVVVIMYQQINSRHMTSSVRALLHTTPYLSYKKGFGEDLFWQTIIKAVQNMSLKPPVAIL